MAAAQGTDLIREAALEIIDRRAIPRDKLRDRLVRKGFETGDVESVLESLEEVGVLDDHAFATDVAERLLEKEPIGRNALSQRLMNKGISAGVVADVIEQMYADRRESEDIERTASRILSRMGSGLAPEVAMRRLAAGLARRGFDEEISLVTAERLLASQTDPSTQ